MIIVMAIIWFVITLPLPWLFTGDVGTETLSTDLVLRLKKGGCFRQEQGMIMIPF